MAAQVALLDFGQHLVHVGGGKLKFRGSPERFAFPGGATTGFLALGGMKGLAYPFSYGHPARAGDALDVAIVGSSRRTWRRLVIC